MHANTFTAWARKLVGLRAGGRVAELEQARDKRDRPLKAPKRERV
jgi:hypothetical protein